MKRKVLILGALIAFGASCTDKFEEFNVDPKNPARVPGETLFPNAQIGLSDQVSSTSVNLNVFKLWAQYWTETTYTNETNDDIVPMTIPDNTFQEYYTGNDATLSGGFLQDFKVAAELIGESDALTQEAEVEKTNKLAIIELLTAYAYQNLVDIFGDVPYSEALNIENIAPKYDDAATIYQDLIRRVDAALASLDESQGSFGSADLIYGGDVASWKRFGNSLKLKLGITISDSHPELSKATVESAVVGGIFTSSEENGELQYLAATHVNTLYEDLVQSGRDDFIPANTIIDLMNGLQDPRMPFYFTQTAAGIYVGGPYGRLAPYSRYSHIAEPITAPDFPGILLTYDEMLFYLAEAAARGYNVGATPDVFYNQAVTASILWWGGTQADADAYLARPEIAYATAAGTWQQKIGTQAYIAFYTRGLEGWTEWRRLDVPQLIVPPRISSYEGIPKRFTYPVNEQTLNKTNYDAASLAIGGDRLTTRLFWDRF